MVLARNKRALVTDSQMHRGQMQRIVRKMMADSIAKASKTEAFSGRGDRTEQLIEAALVPEIIMKGARFDRIFRTVFADIWRTLALAAARANLSCAVTDHAITGVVKVGRLRRIQQVLNAAHRANTDSKAPRPDWARELSHVLKGRGGNIPVTVVCDVYAEDSGRNKRLAFELKAPLPNSDQTKVSKEKLLKLYAMEPRQVDEAYYALPYNPYGRREDYGWSFPARWFNMKSDGVVLIGDEFWEKIGGTGTYQSFIAAVNEIGTKYRERIYREYLGIEPPPSVEEVKLR